MRGKIEEIMKDRTIKVSTDNGPRKLYGLPGKAVIGTVIEYDIVESRAGHQYAKFRCFVEAAEETLNDAEASDTTNANAITGGEHAFQEQNEDGASESSNTDGENELYPENECMSVSELDKKIIELVENNTCAQNIWVKGEVTNYSGQSNNNHFFCLKETVEENGREIKWIINCVVWTRMALDALDFDLQNGQKVAVKGSLRFYPGKSECRIVISKIINIGEGEARLRYERLKERLRNEGLFDPDHHRDIPTRAEKIGILTAQSGEALQDITKVWKERNRYVQLVLYPVNVQGSRAVETNVAGIRRLDQENLDVIIISRGGGSDEDLSVYDAEEMIRAVFDAETPIVSAVGHEGHHPLIDDVADARFATPTDAAQHVIFDVETEKKKVNDLKRQIADKTANIVRERQLNLKRVFAEIQGRSPVIKVKEKQAKLDSLVALIEQNGPGIKVKERFARLERLKAQLDANSPERKLADKRNHLESEINSLKVRMERIFTDRKTRCEKLIIELHGLSPTAKLVGGFGYISSNNRPVMSIDEVKVGDAVSVMIHDGEISASVSNVCKKSI